MGIFTRTPFWGRKYIRFASLGPLTLFLSAGWSSPAFGAESPEASSGGQSGPELVARTYSIRVVRPSNSGKVYLLQKTDASKPLPTEGKILLLKDLTEKPLMALRVVRQYPEKGSFAAKRIKRYGETRRLQRRAIIATLEKAGDYFLPLPATPDQASELNRELLEIESPIPSDLGDPDLAPPPPSPDGNLNENPDTLEEPLPDTSAFDPELDKTSSPVPKGPSESLDANREVSALARDLSVKEDGSEYELEAASASAEDMVQFDWLTGSLGGHVGLYKNNTLEGTSVYFTGAGIRYGTSVGRYILLKSAHIQDSLSIDGALGIYKILNFIDADAYTVAPITLTARYNIHLSNSFALFFYGGFNKGVVTSAVASTSEGIAALTSFLPSAGMGLSIGVGPRWEFRGDLGIDVISAGLVLRF